jgi:xanthine dehydrogenase accessory factor
VESIYSALAAYVREGRPVTLATLVTSPEGGPSAGAKLLVPGDGSPPLGAIHPTIDASIVEEAGRLLLQERSLLVSRSIPEGTLEVFVESFPPPQHLVIVGAVHVAIPLCKLGKLLGYRVTVVDPRAVFATPSRFPEADRLIVEWPDEAFAHLHVTMSTSIVVLTHDPKLDLPALFAGLNSPARYVGAIGSRTTVAQRIADLAEMGIGQEDLDRLHSPIGLNIGSRTPAEIALSIMAEVVAVRRVQAQPR